MPARRRQEEPPKRSDVEALRECLRLLSHSEKKTAAAAAPAAKSSSGSEAERLERLKNFMKRFQDDGEEEEASAKEGTNEKLREPTLSSLDDEFRHALGKHAINQKNFLELLFESSDIFY